MKKDAITQIQTAGQNEARLSLLFRHHLTARANLHPTDLECLDLIIDSRSTTPGALSRSTGLSTGAMTAALDRLEARGMIQRTRSDSDRRSIIIEPLLQQAQSVLSLYSPFVTDATALLDRYSITELQLIRQHYQAMARIYETHIKSLL
jgi:DNA-binding MarR family transcriptional regulator